jgi:clan AA aspartic protease
VGLVSVIAKVSGPLGSEVLEFLVDSGATYSLLPEAVWKSIGLLPKREMTFSLADGSKMTRQISECLFEFDENESHTPVILGEGGDEALLGVITLENMGLILNPFKRQLQPMRLVMA